MKYKLKMTESEVLDVIAASVKYARKFVSDVEFSAEDASRSDLDFLVKAVETAIKSGAATVNLPDTVGYCVPAEMAEKIRCVLERAAGAEKVTFSSHNHNDLGMGVANSLAMIAAGATQVECTVNGIGERAGNASMEEIVMALKVRGDVFGADTRIDTTRLYRLSKLIASITGVPVPPTKPVVGANAFAHESGVHQHGVLANKATYEIMRPEDVGIPENKIVLGKHSGKHAFTERLSALGYSFTAEKTAEYFDLFKKLCDKKKYVSDKDIIALVSGAGAELERQYTLKDFSVSSGLNSAATATVVLLSGGKTLKSTMSGDGPVDGAFKAINAVVKSDITLDDYFLNSVTEGGDAQAEAVVRLSFGGVKRNGRGVSTDVVEASILAYIDGVNKL